MRHLFVKEAECRLSLACAKTRSSITRWRKTMATERNWSSDRDQYDLPSGEVVVFSLDQLEENFSKQMPKKMRRKALLSLSGKVNDKEVVALSLFLRTFQNKTFADSLSHTMWWESAHYHFRTEWGVRKIHWNIQKSKKLFLHNISM